MKIVNTAALKNATLALIVLSILNACQSAPIILGPDLTSTPLGAVTLAWNTAKRSPETDSSGAITRL